MDRQLVVREEDREHIEKLLKLAESEEQCLKGWALLKIIMMDVAVVIVSISNQSTDIHGIKTL